MPEAGRLLAIFHCRRCKATRSEIPLVPERDNIPFGYAEGDVLFWNENQLLGRMLFRPHQ